MTFAIERFTVKFPETVSANTCFDAVRAGALTGTFSNYDADKSIGKSRHLSAATKLFSSTACKLLEDSESAETLQRDPGAIGVFFAGEHINLEDDFVFDMCARNHGPDYVSPLHAPNTLANVVASHFARFAGVQGPNCTVSSGQSSLAHTLDLAFLSIENESINLGIIGAVEIFSPYHQSLHSKPRELACSFVVRRSREDDQVLVHIPTIFTSPTPDLNSVVTMINQSINTKNLPAGLDCLIIASASKFYDDSKSLAAAMYASNSAQYVIDGEAWLGQTGECANAFVFAGWVNETLTKGLQVPKEATPYVLGEPTAAPSTIGILACDDDGQHSLVIFQKR
ncbi:beta-ketoacyl synthase N-terminal-like domain-containing protein [Microbulbifer sp. HZ11]|uniref:beta-ketoacyl synthase N-terminal-like domain-containing protein n=1 Tax=Microbulbifer sp. HZ11 TaxID=1453501 RepID=UPI0005BDEF46|nr:beta-ketoacyl synthase N-terminal-like domain-containing protein [Microbulbifer sp. HZ11]